ADRSALAGSASRMIDLVRVMVNQVGVPLHEAVAMATANSARALGLTTKGKLEAGADADLVVPRRSSKSCKRSWAASRSLFCSRRPVGDASQHMDRGYSESKNFAISRDAFGRPRWLMFAAHSRHCAASFANALCTAAITAS